jgi:hypothetical protein
MKTAIPEPGKQLICLVRSRFVARGTSLQRWCAENDIDWSYAYRSLKGTLTFPKAVALRERILAAVEIQEAA